jgi:chromosome partitioning protein
VFVSKKQGRAKKMQKPMQEKPYIFVVGNEKGGAGKTTVSMHLIASLLALGFKVASMDVDSRQRSLTRYIQNRLATESARKFGLLSPQHFLVKSSNALTLEEKHDWETQQFTNALAEASLEADFIVIDTPGSNSFLSRLAHSYAHTLITPINDSFIDVDLLATIDPLTFNVASPSIYSQMIWEQKMERAKRDQGSIEWIVLRNRLSTIDAKNKRNITQILEKLSKRVGFQSSAGFSERVIFRELFLQGLTLLDIKNVDCGIQFSLSHIAARQELSNFLKDLAIEVITDALGKNPNFSSVKLDKKAADPAKAEETAPMLEEEVAEA